MLRILRIAGILFFALMIGVAANTIWEMRESGELYEKYNSRRKANVTILGASIIAVGVLGAFELSRARRRAERRGFGIDSAQSENEQQTAPPTDIYSAPEHRDVWGSRRRGGRSRHHQKHTPDILDVWMVLLRIFCFVLPVFYLVLVVNQLLKGTSPTLEYWAVTGAFAFMALLAFIAATGLCLIKTWGYSIGYVVAILNLIVFPIGTALGLIVLVTLVGTAPLFSVSDRERRTAIRKKDARKKRAQSSAG